VTTTETDVTNAEYKFYKLTVAAGKEEDAKTYDLAANLDSILDETDEDEVYEAEALTAGVEKNTFTVSNKDLNDAYIAVTVSADNYGSSNALASDPVAYVDYTKLYDAEGEAVEEETIYINGSKTTKAITLDTAFTAPAATKDTKYAVLHGVTASSVTSLGTTQIKEGKWILKDKNLSNIASTKYSKGKITITAKKTPGTVKAWAALVATPKKGTKTSKIIHQACVTVDVVQAPKKVEFTQAGSDNKQAVQKKISVGINQDTADIYLKPTDGAKTSPKVLNNMTFAWSGATNVEVKPMAAVYEPVKDLKVGEDFEAGAEYYLYNEEDETYDKVEGTKVEAQGDEGEAAKTPKEYFQIVDKIDSQSFVENTGYKFTLKGINLKDGKITKEKITFTCLENGKSYKLNAEVGNPVLQIALTGSEEGATPQAGNTIDIAKEVHVSDMQGANQEYSFTVDPKTIETKTGGTPLSEEEGYTPLSTTDKAKIGVMNTAAGYDATSFAAGKLKVTDKSSTYSAKYKDGALTITLKKDKNAAKGTKKEGYILLMFNNAKSVSDSTYGYSIIHVTTNITEDPKE
jgi:hypothetical protein